MKLLGGILLLLFSASWVLAIPFLPLHPERPVHWSPLDQIDQPRLLVYFGSSLCGDQCPATLGEAASFFFESPQAQKQLGFLFVSLDPEDSTPAAARFAHSLHPHFRGIQAQDLELASLRDQFGLNFRQGPQGLEHRGRLYLLEKRTNRWFITSAFEPERWDRQDLKQLIQ